MDKDEVIAHQYSKAEVIFTPEVVKLTHLMPKNCVLKCGSYHFPMVIYSSSIKKALVVLQNSDNFKEVLRDNNNQVELRFYLYHKNGEVDRSFWLAGTAFNLSDYPSDVNLSFLSITYNDHLENTKPLISLLLPLITATLNSKRRLNDAIVDPSGQFIDLQHLFLTIDNEDKRCYLHHLSASMVTLITKGLVLPLGAMVILHLACKNPKQKLTIMGQVAASRLWSEKYQLVSTEIAFDAFRIPLSYKILLDNLFNLTTK